MRALKENRPDLYNKLVEAIHTMTDPKMLKVLNQQGMYIDWDEIAHCMKDEHNSWVAPPVIKPIERVS